VHPSISGDGRYVAFESLAQNLVEGDGNQRRDIFVHDRVNHTTERVSVATGGIELEKASRNPAISADGRYVAFQNLGDKHWDILVHDRVTGVTTLVSVASDGTPGDKASQLPSISADGRLVAFESAATNLVPDDMNGRRDVFVRDRDADGDGIFDEAGGATTERASVSSMGTESVGNSQHAVISGDGRFVAFDSFAKQLVPDDGNNRCDVFVRDRLAGTTVLVSLSSAGAPGDGDSRWPTISANGRFLAFWSAATNLITTDDNGRRDVFFHDRDNDRNGTYDEPGTFKTFRASVSSTGEQGDFGSAIASRPSLAANGKLVVFDSDATNLVTNDLNERRDVFQRKRRPKDAL
jgi:Tol biopolymer transport system component